jgi:FKBP-type peptidyl-prolyl cis-trans isomerase FklB
LKKQQGMTIDVDVFVQGFKDGYSGESPLLSSDEALKILMEIQEEQRAQQLAEKNKMAAENKKAGEAFLAENMKKEGVMTLDSGLQYKVIKAGDGQKPKKNRCSSMPLPRDIARRHGI